jgi:EpsI family protein
MSESNGRFGFLGNKYVRLATAVLLVQAAGLYAVSRREIIPQVRPLAEFPLQVGSWRMAREGVVDKEVMQVLRADDVLTRTYTDENGPRGANLFIAFFRSQRTGQAPHSPKNCLPGSGWAPSQSDIVSIVVPGRNEPLEVNRYVVSKGDEKSLVLYWYQSRNRVIASEYRAKMYLVADAIRYNRTDTALVRVVVPISGNEVSAATGAAEDFVRSFFGSLHGFLPS